MVTGIPLPPDKPTSCSPDLLEWARTLLRQPALPSAPFLGEVEEALQQCIGSDPTGEIHAVLGLTQFLREKYGDAAQNLRIACARDRPNPHWMELLAQAERNEVTHFDLGKTTPKFDADKLFAPPALWITAPSGLERLPDGPGLVRRFFRGVNMLLAVATVLPFALVLRFVGRHGPQRTWEIWPKDRWHVLKDLRLASIRDFMNRHTQHDAYAGQLVGRQTPGQKRPEWTERFRTATGAWNTDNPMEGAAGTRFLWGGREPAEAVRRNRLADPDLPNPIAVANAIFRCEGEQQTAPFLNLLTIAWIQYMLHDWLNHRQSPDLRDIIAIEIPKDDPRREKYGQDYMVFRGTQPSLTGEPFAYENEVTGWWDGSQIYGSDQATQDRLRRRPGADAFLDDGKLREDDGLLPLDPDSRVIDSGFTRNMWVGLELFHTLFVKHHNYLCDEYRNEHPTWSSDQLFHQARLENAATMAKIHSIEWTPAVLPTKELSLGMATNWHGMVEGLLRPFERRRPLRLLEIANPVLGGVIGGTLNNFGIPQNFSEQFAEVYRLHSGMPDAIQIRPVGRDVTERVPTDLTRAANSHATLAKHGMATLINSFGWQHMPALVHNNHPKFMTDMSTEGSPVVDLAAADIVRGRERGIPPFNEFKRQIGMAPIRRFEDLDCDAQTVARLEALYGEGTAGVERMDLVVGMHCDMNRPLRGFDQTRFAIFLQAASRRLQTDPFYTTKYEAQYYTASGLARIDKTTLKSLLLLHYPELARGGLRGVNNAFEPWGTTADMRPSEHPLTEDAERYVTKYPGRLAGPEEEGLP